MPSASDPPLVFSDEWGRRVEAAINRSDRYREAAAEWRDSLGLELAGAPAGAPRAAVLDLHAGVCRGVATGEAARLEEAVFLLQADAGRWQELLAGDLEPIWGIVSGRLRLARGSPAALLPFAEAARALVEAIATVEAKFPPDGKEPP